MRKFFTFLSFTFLFLFFIFAVYLFNLFLSTSGSPEQKVIFEVQSGATFQSVSKRLIHQGLVSVPPHWLRLFGKLSGYSNRIQVGEYELNKGMTVLEIFDVLSSGRSIEYELVVKEGLTMYEIAALLERKNLGSRAKFLEHCKDQDFIKTLLNKKYSSLEGYLFPDTYSITKYTSEKSLVKIMVQRFHKIYREVIKGRNTSLTVHEHVILASIIEKETGVPEERPLISSVFQNRLRKKMRLQSDPTILYGILDEKKVLKKNITKKDILHKDRYNTYRIHGLPYGPIANPGKEALISVLEPEESDFLYFVSKNDGSHKFSKTYKEHLKAVRLYQLKKPARVIKK